MTAAVEDKALVTNVLKWAGAKIHQAKGLVGIYRSLIQMQNQNLYGDFSTEIARTEQELKSFIISRRLEHFSSKLTTLNKKQ